mgnify:CR=1 FL=1
MPTITVRDIPDKIYERLKASAELNHRSINGEIIACIERHLTSQEIYVEAFLLKARTLRRKTAGHAITDAEIAQAKADGRP